MPIRGAPVLAVLLALCAPARAEAPVRLEALTWTELRDQVKAGKTTILVPIGATEQNGPHMALGKHNVRAAKLAERIARELGDALVAPVIAYVPEGRIDPPEGHMRFPGTISIPEDAFERTLEAAARSFRRAGFRDVVFLPDHGGYLKNVAQAAARVNRDWARTPARAHALEAYYRAAGIAGHADATDTSLAWAVDPALVRAERLGSAAPPGAADGVRGDPRGATVDEGQRIANLVVSRSVDAIRKAVRR